MLQRLGQALPTQLCQYPAMPTSPVKSGAALAETAKTYLTAHAHLPARNAESDLGWHIVARIPVDIAFAQADAAVAKALLVAWRRPPWHRYWPGWRAPAERGPGRAGAGREGSGGRQAGADIPRPTAAPKCSGCLPRCAT